jgi:ABC-type branched-subunit amino acid transport system ATPase component
MGSILEVSKLSKRFGGLTAVSELDFDVREGEILGMIGPNGAGKSTTFNLIAGAYPASSGEISFKEESILGLPPHQIARRGILRTFQHNRPFEGMPVIDNVLVGAHRLFTKNSRHEEAARRGRAEELIEFVGLGGLAQADVGTLSFGQGRLLEIARALAGEPRLILFDEPAARVPRHRRAWHRGAAHRARHALPPAARAPRGGAQLRREDRRRPAGGDPPPACSHGRVSGDRCCPSVT